MTDWEKVDQTGKAMQQIGCAGCVLVFIVLPLLFVACAVLSN